MIETHERIKIQDLAIPELAREPKESSYLRIAAEHPELLVWLAEIITFQESTLSLPDYYSPQFQPHEPSSVPIVRRF